MIQLDAPAIAELRAALLSVDCPPDAPEQAQVALVMLRAMYSELCDLALYAVEHENNRADCDAPGFREWQEDRDSKLLGQPQINLNVDEEVALD